MAGDDSFGIRGLESADELIALPARAAPGVKGTELAGNGRTPCRKTPQSGTKRDAQPWSGNMPRPITRIRIRSKHAAAFVDGPVVNARPLASSTWGYLLCFIDNRNAARKHFILEITSPHKLAKYRVVAAPNTFPKRIPDRCCRSSRVLRTNLRSGHFPGSTFATAC